MSGTQRSHFTTNAGTVPLTLAPKSIRDFRRECALTRNRSVPQECSACIHRMQNIKGFGHSPTSILNLIFKNQIQKSCRGTTAHCLPQLCVICYEVKCGQYTFLKGAQQKWFVRFRILDAVYNEYELKVDIVGKAEHHSTRNSRLKSSSLIC